MAVRPPAQHLPDPVIHLGNQEFTVRAYTIVGGQKQYEHITTPLTNSQLQEIQRLATHVLSASLPQDRSWQDIQKIDHAGIHLGTQPGQAQALPHAPPAPTSPNQPTAWSELTRYVLNALDPTNNPAPQNANNPQAANNAAGAAGAAGVQLPVPKHNLVAHQGRRAFEISYNNSNNSASLNSYQSVSACRNPRAKKRMLEDLQNNRWARDGITPTPNVQTDINAANAKIATLSDKIGSEARDAIDTLYNNTHALRAGEPITPALYNNLYAVLSKDFPHKDEILTYFNTMIQARGITDSPAPTDTPDNFIRYWSVTQPPEQSSADPYHEAFKCLVEALALFADESDTFPGNAAPQQSSWLADADKAVGSFLWKNTVGRVLPQVLGGNAPDPQQPAGNSGGQPPSPSQQQSNNRAALPPSGGAGGGAALPPSGGAGGGAASRL